MDSDKECNSNACSSGSDQDEHPVYEECIPDPDRPGVWTIPGYIGYNVDNPAFHDVDIPSVHFTAVPPTPVKKNKKVPPPPTPNEKRLHKSTSSSSSSSSSSSPPLFRMLRLRVSKGGRRDRRATALLCVLVTALVLLLATVAVVLYLTVGGGLAQLSGKKQAEETRKVHRQVDGSFRIMNRIFEEPMSERGSAQFAMLSSDVIRQMEGIFRKSSIAAKYNSTEVTALRNGSVVVEFIVHLEHDLPEAAKKVGMAFERGLVNDYGQIRLGEFLVDFPSIKFKVESSTHDSSSAEPFEGERHDNENSLNPHHPHFAGNPPRKDGNLDSEDSDIFTPSHFPNNNFLFPSSGSPQPSTTSTTTTTTTTEMTTTTTHTTTTFLPPTTRKVPLYPPVPGGVQRPPPPPPQQPLGLPTTYPPWFPRGTRFPTPPSILTNPSILGSIADRHFPRRPYPGAGYSPRSEADLLVQWSEWSPWSNCDARACATNQTKIRTRECRTRNGTGPKLNDTRLCTLLGGVATEIKECPCGSAPGGMMTSFGLSRAPQDSLPSSSAMIHHSGNHNSNNNNNTPSPLCLRDEWQCKDGLCIPKEKRCDGHFNCYDMTDEYDCDCAPGYFHCGNNTSCIPNEKRCDGEIDCWDGQDEANCTKLKAAQSQSCDPGFVSCNLGKNNTCIPNYRFCDGFVDCSDSSDEPEGCRRENVGDDEYCLSTNSQFKCRNNRCVPVEALCDAVDHCGDGSDEAEPACGNWTSTNNATSSNVRPQLWPPPYCSKEDGEFECSSGNCIAGDSVCDGVEDCADSSDEFGCSNVSSKVSSKANPNVNLNVTMLPVNYDVAAMTTMGGRCSESEYACANERCINKRDLCDTVNDCGDFSDETNCDHGDHRGGDA